MARFLAIVLLFALTTGCAYVDGGFTYTASGRLVDDQRQPLANRPVLVWLSPLTDTNRPKDFRRTTTEDGQFSQKLMTGLAWGYTCLFGVIPLGSTHPNPPPVKQIYISVERSPGEWIEREILLDKAQQKEPGTISMGDVVVPR